MPNVLEIARAVKRFDTTVALDDVSLVLRRGEWLGLLGPNGAGKTTLVRSVAGRVHLDQGSIAIDNQTINRYPVPHNLWKKLGIVTQDIALYALLTAAENLEVWGSLHGLSGEKLSKQVQWALEWTGLKDRSKEPIKKFSGGMKRRLNIACGILHDPEILLLDEPTVGVDPQSRQRIWEMLMELHAKGVSLLLTTHQMEEARLLCERIVIIDHGHVIADGSFEELVQQTIGPGHRLTLQLEGGIPASLNLNQQKVISESTLQCMVTNVSEELPEIMSRISKTGAIIRELSIDEPSLQEVFIHLTGRELRE